MSSGLFAGRSVLLPGRVTFIGLLTVPPDGFAAGFDEAEGRVTAGRLTVVLGLRSFLSIFGAAALFEGRVAAEGLVWVAGLAVCDEGLVVCEEGFVTPTFLSCETVERVTLLPDDLVPDGVVLVTLVALEVPVVRLASLRACASASD